MHCHADTLKDECGMEAATHALVTKALPAAAAASLVQTARASAAGPAAPAAAAAAGPPWPPCRRRPHCWAPMTRRQAPGPRRRTGLSCQGLGAPAGPQTLCGHSTGPKSTRKHPKMGQKQRSSKWHISQGIVSGKCLRWHFSSRSYRAADTTQHKPTNTS